MDKHSKRSASIFRYPVLMAFTLFFAGLFVLDLVTPDRAYSELENTTLSQRPGLSSVSADGLNKFFTAYTKYVKDQVVSALTFFREKKKFIRNEQKNVSFFGFPLLFLFILY